MLNITEGVGNKFPIFAQYAKVGRMLRGRQLTVSH